MELLLNSAIRFVWRALLLVMGLVFAAALLVALMLALAVWGLRYAFARLTGRPVQAWVFRIDPRAGLRRFTDPAAGDLPRQGPTWTRDRAWRHDEGVADVTPKEPPAG